MRRKLRDPVGRAIYARRKAIVEPVNGVLKEQRGMRQFRMKGLPKVAVEWTLASIGLQLDQDVTRPLTAPQLTVHRNRSGVKNKCHQLLFNESNPRSSHRLFSSDI